MRRAGAGRRVLECAVATSNEFGISLVEGHSRAVVARGAAQVVPLLSIEGDGAPSVFLQAELGPDGALCIAGQDLHGSSDYEYFLDVEPRHVGRVRDAVLRSLAARGHHTEDVLSAPGVGARAALPRTDARAVLLALRYAYQHEVFTGRSDLAAFLDRVRIPYELSSYGSPSW